MGWRAEVLQSWRQELAVSESASPAHQISMLGT